MNSIAEKSFNNEDANDDFLRKKKTNMEHQILKHKLNYSESSSIYKRAL